MIFISRWCFVNLWSQGQDWSEHLQFNHTEQICWWRSCVMIKITTKATKWTLRWDCCCFQWYESNLKLNCWHKITALGIFALFYLLGKKQTRTGRKEQMWENARDRKKYHGQVTGYSQSSQRSWKKKRAFETGQISHKFLHDICVICFIAMFTLSTICYYQIWFPT